MNITITNHRFAVRPLLLCLTLLVTSVSGCAPLNTYSGRPFTPAAVTYNSIETPADRRDFDLRVENAFKLTVKGYDLLKDALESNSAGTLVYAREVLLSAARALSESARDGALHMASGKIFDKNFAKQSNDCENWMCIILNRVETIGADRTAVGKIYYDYARVALACSSVLRARGREDIAVQCRNDAIQYMRAAQSRGIAEAAAYLRTH